MSRDFERRLRRAEERCAPSMPMQALTVTATNAEDATRQIAEATASGRHRPGWPVMILTIGTHP